MEQSWKVHLLAAGFLTLVTAGGIYGAIQWGLRLPQLPYNVRELFPASHPNASVAVFSVLLVWLGLGPAWGADYLCQRPRQLPFLPLWAASIGLVSWGMLRFAVTRESLGDVLGWPTLGWGGDWELLCRFLALQATVTLPLLVANVVTGSVFQLGWRHGLKRGAFAAACGLPWLILAWAVVVGWANTDNLTELIRAKPWSWIGPVFLATLLILAALNASLLSHAWVARGMAAKLVAALVTLVLVFPGWGLLWYGLEPAVEKYGMTFPAVRFLLGPDRQTAISIGDLAIRWGVIQLAGVLILAVGGAIALLLPRSGKDRNSPTADQLNAEQLHHMQSGRAAAIYLMITVVYTGFLIYGSLIPLNFQPMALGDAIDAFRGALHSARTPWSQSDMVTNTAMFVPWTFCAFGAWACKTRRWGRWWWAAAIFVVGVTLSCVLEFSQVFVPGRTTSVHDIIAQTIGNGLGLAVWLAFGPPLTQWVGGLVRERDRSTLCIRLLYSYAALLLLYSLLPLNLTISVGQIWRKYQAGMINFLPFGNPHELNALAVVMKTILYVPIGYLFACRAGRGGRPLVMAVVGGVLFSAGIELLQVFVRSRIATVTDVLLGASGALFGGLVAWFTGPAAAGKGLRGAWWRRWGIWLKIPAAAGWVALMASPWWGEMVMTLTSVARSDAGSDVLAAALRTPPGSMVYSAGPLEAVARLAQEFGACLVLGLLIQALFASSKSRRILATATSVLLVLVLEFGGLRFSPDRFDIVLSVAAIAGAVAGYWVYPKVIEIFLTPADTSCECASVCTANSTPGCDRTGCAD